MPMFSWHIINGYGKVKERPFSLFGKWFIFCLMVVLCVFHIEMENLQRTKLREMHLILKLREFQVSRVDYAHSKSTQGWSTPTVGALAMGE